MKLGFICLNVPGHLNPMTTLARHLQYRNHEVVFLYSSGAAGLPFVPGPEKDHFNENRPAVSKMQGEDALQFTAHVVLAQTEALVDGDIGDSATAQKITDTAIARFGRIDVLVNNAGLLVSKPFVDYTPGDFEALVSTILAGFFYITQSAAKQMLHQQSGHIVNISTSVVDQPIAGVPCALQVLAKGGLHAVTRALAIEYAGQGIRVNTVALGAIKTPMHKMEAHDFLKSLQPIGRMGEIDEVVDAVMYLNDATFVTGEVLHVDGGAQAGKW